MAFALLLCIGCSSAPNPSSPDMTSSDTQIASTQALINELSGVFGEFELNIDKTNGSAELIPIRKSTIGESYIVSGIGFFTVAPCLDCLKIKSISLTSDDTVKLDLSVRHPFEPGDIYKPPSAVNRLDLDIFDAALIIKPEGITPTSFPYTGSDIFDAIVVAPDGYTRELAMLPEMTSAALPYYLLVDETEISPLPNPTTFNKFAMGDSTTLATEFSFDSYTQYSFRLYLTMGYGASARRPERLMPKYYNPEFNKKAAWKVNVIPPEGNDPPELGNTWQDDDFTTTYKVKVEVYDWQIGAPVYSGSNFADANTDEIFEASNPSKVSVEILGMNLSSISSTTPDNPSGTGRPGNPWIFTFPIANENGLAPGQYHGVVKITDERATASDIQFQKRDYLIDAPNGIDMYNYIIDEYATYQTFVATVVEHQQPQEGVKNVWITVNRVLPNPVPAYAKGEMFDPAQPWTLHWDAVADVAEYAVYYDNDPGDYNLVGWSQSELTNNLQFVATTTSTSFNVPPSHLPSNHYVIGNTYIIRARTVAGDPSSELPDSEPAYIMANGWETTPAQKSAIINYQLFEGWQAGWEIDVYDTDPWHFYYYICTDDLAQNVLHGAKSARASSCFVGRSEYPYPGRWDTLVKRTPVVPDAPVRFLDSAFQHWATPTVNATMGGIFVGTCSEPRPFHPWTTPTNFEWALVLNTPPYDGYNNSTDTFVRNTFDDVHTDAPWCWSSTDLYTTDTGWRVGCDVNATANPDDPYIGFASGRISYYLIHANYFIDDIAIMLY